MPLASPLLRAASWPSHRTSDSTQPPPPDFTADDGPRIRWHAQSLSRGAAGLRLDTARAPAGHGGRTPTNGCDDRAYTRNGSGAARSAVRCAGNYDVLTMAAVSRPSAASLDVLDDSVANLTRALRPRRRASRPVPGPPCRCSTAWADLVGHLLRREPDGLLRQVLTYLVRLTDPIDIDDEAGRLAPGWWSRTCSIPTALQQATPTSCARRHGITGPASASAMRHNILVPGQAEQLPINTWLDDWCRSAQPDHGGQADHGNRAARRQARDTRTGSTVLRYGTPGIARAQQLAGIAFSDPLGSRQRKTPWPAAVARHPVQLNPSFAGPIARHGLRGAPQRFVCRRRCPHHRSAHPHAPRDAPADSPTRLTPPRCDPADCGVNRNRAHPAHHGHRHRHPATSLLIHETRRPPWTSTSPSYIAPPIQAVSGNQRRQVNLTFADWHTARDDESGHTGPTSAEESNTLNAPDLICLPG